MELDDDEWSESTDPMMTFAREPFLAEQVAEFLDSLPEIADERGDDELPEIDEDEIIVVIETELRAAA